MFELKKVIMSCVSSILILSFIVSGANAAQLGSMKNVVSAQAISSDDNVIGIKSVYSLTSRDQSKFNVECTNGITYSFEAVGIETEKILLDEEVLTVSDNEVEINRMYLDGSNNIISDHVKITRSSSGSDIVTRQSQISNFTVVEITASFDWYKSGMYSYVRCSGMAACYSQHTNLGCSYFIQSKSEGYISIGPAYAQVEYKFYNIQYPLQYQQGTFRINCTDSGTISDNGY